MLCNIAAPTLEPHGTSVVSADSAVGNSPTPSPASSTGSQHSVPPGFMMVAQNMDQVQKNQLAFLHNLMFADHWWSQAEAKTQTDDKGKWGFGRILREILGKIWSLDKLRKVEYEFFDKNICCSLQRLWSMSCQLPALYPTTAT